MLSSHAFRALHHRNFRRFLLAIAVSKAGMWLQTVALGWLVYRLTNSPLLLGVVTVVPLLPLAPVTLFAGVFTDRVNSRKLYLAAQAALFLQTSLLAWLVLSNKIQIWHIVAFSFGIGLAIAVGQAPARVLILDLVGKEDLSSAISLNSMTNNLARILGPVLAGFVIARWGEGLAFLGNALSYIPLLLVLITFPDVARPRAALRKSARSDFRSGVEYAFQHVSVRFLLLITGVTAFLLWPYVHLMPVFAVDALNMDARGLGWLMAFVGAGSILGALFAARVPSHQMDRWIGVAAVCTPVLLMGFASLRVSPLPFVSLLLLACSGMVLRVLVNTAIQTRADYQYQGRVMSFFALLILGMSRIGALALAAVAEWVGVDAAIFAAGLLAFGWGLYVLLRQPHKSFVALKTAS